MVQVALVALQHTAVVAAAVDITRDNPDNLALLDLQAPLALRVAQDLQVDQVRHVFLFASRLRLPINEHLNIYSYFLSFSMKLILRHYYYQKHYQNEY